MIDLFLEVLFARLGAPTRRKPRQATVAELAAMRRLRLQYRAWAKKEAFRGDDDVWEGRLAACAVTVQPGLGGPVPAGVETTVTLVHGRPSARFTPQEPGTLAACFLEDGIRSIAFATDEVRVRFAPLTPPEGILEALLQVLEHVRPRDGTPFRG